MFIAGDTAQVRMIDIPICYWTSDVNISIAAEIGCAFYLPVSGCHKLCVFPSLSEAMCFWRCFAFATLVNPASPPFPLAAVEASFGTYSVGVTDGAQVWVAQFSRQYVTAYQWAFGDVLSAPSGDTTNPFPLNLTSGWSTTFQVAALVFCLSSCHRGDVGAMDTDHNAVSALLAVQQCAASGAVGGPGCAAAPGAQQGPCHQRTPALGRLQLSRIQRAILPVAGTELHPWHE